MGQSEEEEAEKGQQRGQGAQEALLWMGVQAGTSRQAGPAASLMLRAASLLHPSSSTFSTFPSASPSIPVSFPLAAFQ